MYDLCHLRFSSWMKKVLLIVVSFTCLQIRPIKMTEASITLFFWFPYYSIVMINFISKFLVEVILFCIF